MRYAGVGKKKRRLVCPLQWGKDAGNPFGSVSLM